MGKGSKANRTGRNKGLFLALPHSVLNDEAFRQMSSAGKVVIVAVGKLFDGRNNGKLAFSERAARLWGLSEKTARRALIEAQGAGFIRLVKPSSFHNKRLATEWAITWQPLAPGVVIPDAEIFHRGKNAGHRGKNSLCRGHDIETTPDIEGVFPSVSAIAARS